MGFVADLARQAIIEGKKKAYMDQASKAIIKKNEEKGNLKDLREYREFQFTK